MSKFVPFSVLMAVYAGERPDYLAGALASLASSDVAITELVLVKDGVLTAGLEDVLRQYSSSLPMRILALPEQGGLGSALAAGLRICSYSWVARFDSDDLMVSDRFTKQLSWIADHPQLDIVGGYIEEFDDLHPGAANNIRTVPLSHDHIVAYARVRNPFNHMTVMFRREHALAAGGYEKLRFFEDYDLWVKMIQAGALTSNIPEILVKARAGRGMVARRGGWSYAVAEIAMQRRFRQTAFIGVFRMLANIVVRVPVRLLPVQVRNQVYRLLRRRGGQRRSSRS